MDNPSLLAELQRRFNYDPETGVLTYKVPTRQKKAGEVAGHHNWHTGYEEVWIGSRNMVVHRVCWVLHYGKEPDLVLDHINRNPTDNRIENLRDVSRSINALNRGHKNTNSTGFRGVTKSGQRFMAGIRLDYKFHSLGCYSTAEEAAAVVQTFLSSHGACHGTQDSPSLPEDN